MNLSADDLKALNEELLPARPPEGAFTSAQYAEASGITPQMANALLQARKDQIVGGKVLRGGQFPTGNGKRPWHWWLEDVVE